MTAVLVGELEGKSDLCDHSLSDGEQAEEDSGISSSSIKVGVLWYLVIDPSSSDGFV